MPDIGLPQIIADVSRDTGHSQPVTRSVINNFLLQIEASRFRPEAQAIAIKGFGKFRFTLSKPRKARDLSTGKDIDVPAKRRLKFTPSKSLLARIQEKPPTAAPVVVLKRRHVTKS